MDKSQLRIRKFKSFEEQDEADREEMRAMTPEERLDLLEHLRIQGAHIFGYEYPSRLPRVVKFIRKA
jgi:hypothetical protein